jgi:hypothetical protein
MTCADCTYWNETPTVGGGTCHRYAPRPSNSKIDKTYWPRTDAESGCGEWEEKRK